MYGISIIHYVGVFALNVQILFWRLVFLPSQGEAGLIITSIILGFVHSMIDVGVHLTPSSSGLTRGSST